MISSTARFASLSAHQNITADQLRIKTVSNCVVTRSKLAMTWKGVDRSCLFENLPWANWFQINLAGALSVAKNKLEILDDSKKYFLLSNAWSGGYHHWLAEVAIKFLLFEDEIRQGIVLLPGSIPKFVSDFLEIFNFDNVLPISHNAFVRRLNVVTNQNSGHFDGEHITLLRESLFSKLQIAPSALSRKVYVTRRSAKIRKVANENEVMDLLNSYGFECLDLDLMPFRQQVEIFSKTRHFVSIHGAGLTNAIFMPPSGTVVELYPRVNKEASQLNACYRRLCSALGRNHRFIFCEVERPGKRPRFRYDNIVVDICELESQIQSLA